MIPVVVMEENQQLPNSNIYYMIGENGQFIRKKIGLIDCVVPVSKISVLQKIKPYAKLNIPKISEEVFAKVVSFFREVYNLYRSESIVLLYYNENAKSKYLIHVPFQKVKGSSIDYLRANTIKDYTLVCSIHSHSDFGAFHSGTDTNDEKDFDGLHITVGNLADQMVSIVSSIAINGFRVTTDPIDYIEGIDIAPEEDEDSGPF